MLLFIFDWEYTQSNWVAREAGKYSLLAGHNAVLSEIKVGSVTKEDA